MGVLVVMKDFLFLLSDLSFKETPVLGESLGSVLDLLYSHALSHLLWCPGFKLTHVMLPSFISSELQTSLPPSHLPLDV